MGSLHESCACVYNFGDVLVHFEYLWTSFLSPCPFPCVGQPWLPFGSLWEDFGNTLGRVDSVGLPRVILYSRILTEADVQFRADGSRARRLHTESQNQSMRKDRSSQPPFTCTGVQDDVTLERTTSKTYNSFSQTVPFCMDKRGIRKTEESAKAKGGWLSFDTS